MKKTALAPEWEVIHEKICQTISTGWNDMFFNPMIHPYDQCKPSSLVIVVNMNETRIQSLN